MKKSDTHIKLDHDRRERCGFPEFIYGEGKTRQHLVKIIKELYVRKEVILVTRLNSEGYADIKRMIPEGISYDPEARVLYHKPAKFKTKPGTVSILSAGTSDVPVSLEAKYTIEMCGYKVNTVFDAGVAGIHRLFDRIDNIRKSDVIIVVAGMEGALPSVVAGLISKPIIAVPTSVGYGICLKGLTPLFAMLNSCANGVLVVNIDNGFGAACAAVRMLNLADSHHKYTKETKGCVKVRPGRAGTETRP